MRRLAPIALLLPAFVAACPGDAQNDDEAVLVVGVQTSDLTGALGDIEATTTTEGTIARETISPAALPKELELRGRPGARVDVNVIAAPVGGAGPTLSRIASARIPAGKRLLRINLEARCMGVTCPANETCVYGRCASAEVPFDLLETYEPGWPSSPPDICRPAQHGAPEVILGTGQTDYAPLADGATLQLEKGPQGGHHIWIGARMKNLKQSGSVTTITAKVPDDPSVQPPPPAAFVFSFDRDEGAYCKIYGLRFQLDAGAADLGSAYKRFLGKQLAVTVEVAEQSGARAQSTKTIRIGDRILCPDGTETCNQP